MSLVKRYREFILIIEKSFTNTRYIAWVRYTAMRGVSSHARNVILRKDWFIWVFNDNDAPIKDATEIFDILTGIANTLHMERVTKIATTGIMSESNVISL